MIKVTASQAAQGYDPQQLIDHLNDTRRGGFLYIHGYCNGNGEVANHWVQGACLYPNLIQRSVAIIDSGELMAKIEAEGLKVTRGGWFNDAGEESPTGRKSKVYSVFQTVSKTYSIPADEDSATDGEISDLAKITVAISNIREGLVNPKKVDQGYKSEAKGAYSKEGEPDGILYFRDCLTVHKHVSMQGEYKQKASKEETAIKAALRKLLPVGRYRAYKLADNFEYITVGGLSIVQGANLSEWELALTETQALKEAELVESAEAVAEAVMENVTG